MAKIQKSIKRNLPNISKKSKTKQENVIKKTNKQTFVAAAKIKRKQPNGISSATNSSEIEEKNTVVKPTKVDVNKRKLDKNDVAGKKRRLQEKVKPPTLDEINNLKETRNLFHSNIFRLQVQEMLREVQIKQKYTRMLNAWLEKFKTFMRKLESQAEKELVTELQWLQECTVSVPFQPEQLRVLTTPQKNLHFQFIKPKTEPYLIGAAACDTLLGPQLMADVCLPMPADCFQKHNYTNYQYEHKRALYLGYVVWQMLQHASDFDDMNAEQLKYNYFGNNPLKPVLEITPSSSNSKLVIRLFVATEESTFKLSRFVPWNNNIRESVFAVAEEPEETTSVIWATPCYNGNVLFDLSMHANQRLLRDTFAAQRNLQEGLLLLKVWLRQRYLHVGYSAFQPHILAMFIVYLQKQGKININMSSYQVARTVWIQLAQSTWDIDGKGITLSNEIAVNQPTMEQMHSYYPVVFVDCTGFYNICSNLTLEVYKRIRSESQLAVDLLNDMKLNSFQLIFMKDCPPYTQFDHILKISKRDAVEQLLELHITPADRCNYAGHAFPLLVKLITNLLRKGLSRRVKYLLPIEQSMQPWLVQTPSAPWAPQYLHLGIILDPEHAFEVLDKGPSSIAENAEEFRKFWGDKAQLRRFQDGTITESVVWASNTDTLRSKRTIVRSIVLHLLQLHLQLEAEDIRYIASDLDMVYCLNSAYHLPKMHAKCPLTQQTDAENATLYVIHAFDHLARQLTSLKDLPLEIVSIAGISSIFRYCAVTPLLPVARVIGEHFYADSVPRAIIQLGQSGKWPSELGALRALKFAFYLQIAKQLREQFQLQVKTSADGLLVYKFGYCFGLEIAHTKELALLKREQNERGIIQYVHSEASKALEQRHYILPRVSAALHGLYQQHPCYGPTVMIAKRWLYAQLIDDGLWPDEVTELLVATLFENRQAQIATCQSPQTGFLRFLQLLAYTDWRSEFFLINFNNVIDESKLSSVEQNFNTERDIYPPLCIATSFDQDHQGLLWTTAERPNVNVLARVTLLARKALQIVQETLHSTQLVFIKPAQLFCASSEGYDLVIQLKPDLIPTVKVPDFGSPFVMQSKPNWRLPLADSHWLADAVNLLREAYSDYAAFFYNPCGGKEIAVIWRPNIFDTLKEFKVTEVNGYSLSTERNKKLQCKAETLIEDFKFILKEYYLRIGSLSQIMEESSKANRNERAMSGRYFTDKSKTTITKPLAPNVEAVQNMETIIPKQNKNTNSKRNFVKHVMSKKLKK